MSNDVKIVDQNPVSSSLIGSQVQPQVPVGSPNKELGSSGVNISEFVRPAGAEVSHKLDQEQVESGVEEKKDFPDLTFEHKQVGIEPAGPHVPVPSGPTGKITLPMSEEEVAGKLKTGKSDDSGKWLAKLIDKVIRALGL